MSGDNRGRVFEAKNGSNIKDTSLKDIAQDELVSYNFETQF